MVYLVAGVPVSPTSVLSFGCVAGMRERISYPVMVGSLGSSHLRVTEDVVEVALRFVGGESGFLGDMPAGSEGEPVVDMATEAERGDSPWPSAMMRKT